MRLHVLTAIVLVGGGWLRPWEWVRDWWRSRSDAAIDRHPMAVALRALRDQQGTRP